jgi:hypothetical protein
MTGRAKWDAWDAACKTYTSSQEAENRYLEIARNLGWSESSAATTSTVQKKQGETGSDGSNVDLEQLSDEEDSPRTQSSSAGLGLSVSTMARQESGQPADKSIHGLALSCDVAGLALLLKEYPHIDLNALDAYVCSCCLEHEVILLNVFG